MNIIKIIITLSVILISSCMPFLRHIDCGRYFYYSGRIISNSDSTPICNANIFIQKLDFAVYRWKLKDIDSEIINSKFDLDSGITNLTGNYKIKSDHNYECGKELKKEYLDSLHIIIQHPLYCQFDSFIYNKDIDLNDSIIILKTIYLKNK